MRRKFRFRVPLAFSHISVRGESAARRVGSLRLLTTFLTAPLRLLRWGKASLGASQQKNCSNLYGENVEQINRECPVRNSLSSQSRPVTGEPIIFFTYMRAIIYSHHSSSRINKAVQVHAVSQPYQLVISKEVFAIPPARRRIFRPVSSSSGSACLPLHQREDCAIWQQVGPP